MVKTAMEENFSWDKTAEEYKKLYEHMLQD
jgi:glycogen synthase